MRQIWGLYFQLFLVYGGGSEKTWRKPVSIENSFHMCPGRISNPGQRGQAHCNSAKRASVELIHFPLFHCANKYNYNNPPFANDIASCPQIVDWARCQKMAQDCCASFVKSQQNNGKHTTKEATQTTFKQQTIRIITLWPQLSGQYLG